MKTGILWLGKREPETCLVHITFLYTQNYDIGIAVLVTLVISINEKAQKAGF